MTTRRIDLLVLLAALTICSPLAGSARDQEAPTATERFTAGIVSTSGGAGRGTARLTVWIDRYSSDDETQRWVKIVVTQSQDFLVNAWQKERPVAGRVKFSGSVVYDLRVARSRPVGKGRKVILVTDRPISGYEIHHGLQEREYPFAWIELDLDAEGKGTGTLVPAVRLSAKNGDLQIEGSGVDPLRLLGVSLTTR